MLKKIIRIPFLSAIVLMFTIAGCTKTTTIVVDNSPTITATVYFTKTIVPILTKSCALAGCHNGSVAPNLTAPLAYSSLIVGNYINTAKPESSEVYLFLTGKRSPTMPLGSANNPSNLNALTLAWIKQGAKNN